MPEKQEIISGLRNAVERGYSLELAVQSFMSAGYSKQDVLDSAKILGYNSGGIISNLPASMPAQSPQIPQEKTQEMPSITPQLAKPPAPIQPRQIPQYQPNPIQQNIQINLPQQGIGTKKSWIIENWLLIFLGLILILLLVGLGLSIFAKQWVVDFLNNIGISIGQNVSAS